MILFLGVQLLLPFAPHHVSRSCSRSSPLHAHPKASSALHVASAQRLDCTETLFSDPAFLDRCSDDCHSRFSAVFLTSTHPLTTSGNCFSGMAHSRKRTCKALELNGGCRVLDTDCCYGFGPKFRVSALHRSGSSGSPGLELEEQTGDDGVQWTLRCSNGNKKSHGNSKSAEELHFEAIEGYLLQYEQGEIGYNGGDGCTSGCKANTAQSEDQLGHQSSPKTVSDGEAVKNNYVKDLPSMDGRESSYAQSIGRKDHPHVQNDLSHETKEIQLLSKVSQSVQQTASGTPMFQPKKTSTYKGNAQTMNSSKDRDSDLKLVKNMCASELDDKKIILQTESKEIEPDEGSVNSDNVCDLREEQKVRMELNKATALARRSMRCCEDAVAQSQAKGLRFPKFESLLVEKSWAEALKSEFQKPYMGRLHQFVSQEAAGRIPIYPPPSKLFNAFNSCPLDKVKVVILGQDPYHAPGQAMGLCFSVEKGSKLPSSLTNIFLEIESDLNCDFPTNGNLEKWAYQGVLLLNTVLTVRDRHPNSHAKKGWEFFTDAAIRTVVQQRFGVVFLLWGNQAQEKIRLINKTSHHILKAYHPSGISAHRGFFRCRHFSKTNQLLIDEGLLPIDWQL